MLNGSDTNDNASDNVPIIAAALPVELLIFTGEKIGKVIQLNWETASEQNNSGFQVLKSGDGIDWKVIGWVEGNGTINDLNYYDFIDKAPYIGDNYFRLQQFDFDGKYEFSNVIIIENLKTENAINILPNPSTGKFVATVENPNKEKMKITLFDSTGKAVWRSELLEDLTVWRKDFYLVIP